MFFVGECVQEWYISLIFISQSPRCVCSIFLALLVIKGLLRAAFTLLVKISVVLLVTVVVVVDI